MRLRFFIVFLIGALIGLTPRLFNLQSIAPIVLLIFIILSIIWEKFFRPSSKASDRTKEMVSGMLNGLVFGSALSGLVDYFIE